MNSPVRTMLAMAGRLMLEYNVSRVGPGEKQDDRNNGLRLLLAVEKTRSLANPPQLAL